MKNILKLILKIGISVILLILLFGRIDLRQTISHISKVEPLNFLFAVLIFLFVIFLGVVRWAVLLKISKKDLSFRRIFLSYCGGLFFNVCLPSTIGGDVTRTADLAFHTKDSSFVFATVFLDRLYGFLALVIIFLFGFAYSYFFGLGCDFKFLIIMSIFGAIIAFAYVLIFSQAAFNLIVKIVRIKFLREYLTKFHDSCYSFRSQKEVLFKTLLLSLLIQGLFSVCVYFIGLSLGIKLHIAHYMTLIPVMNTIAFLPISIGGLGLRDHVAVKLFSPLGVAEEKVFAMTILIFAFLFFVALVGGIIYGSSLYSRRL
jgi:uncharacterized protein (TIRG00374 family)